MLSVGRLQRLLVTLIQQVPDPGGRAGGRTPLPPFSPTLPTRPRRALKESFPMSATPNSPAATNSATARSNACSKKLPD
jgi:hypothetical protein